MYGLKVHERVLANVEDLIAREKEGIENRFFTYPTVHEAVLNYDSGESLLRACVEIPKSIIKDRLEKKITLTEAAERLQKYVLSYEWMVLPTAVKMAAQKILDEKNSEMK
jgi:folate-dependent phosphoribosylglycinamide formyltransferase PurN